MRKIEKIGNNFVIWFDYDPKAIAAVKLIAGRRFDHLRKCWIVPQSSAEQVERFAKQFRFSTSWETVSLLDNFDHTILPLPQLQQHIPLKMDLYDFQREGVAYCLEHERVIIGDQPGLGKTGQAIAAVTAADAFPCLVISPNSLRINWHREFEMWSSAKPLILSDSSKDTFQFYAQTGMNNVFIANYESLKKYFVQKIEQPILPNGKKSPLTLKHIRFKESIKIFKSVIVDESHRCKDLKTQQTKFVKGITSGKKYIFLLTGTPVVNKPKDLIPQIGILDKMNHFGGFPMFSKLFVDSDKNYKELNVLLNRHCFYRREKKDVLKQLPDKVRQAVYCDITSRKEYNDAMADLGDYLARYRQASDEQIQRSLRGEIMVRIGILKNISARGKIGDVVDYVSDIVDSGEKIILFTHLIEVSDMLKTHFPAAVTILGKDSLETRQANIDKFQNDPKCQVIICSIKAAGVGITLTASSRVAFVELPWHPADCEQCEDRAHRIGQKDSVQATYFLGKDTIDEHIYSLIGEKRFMSDQITGAQNEIPEIVFDDIVKFLTNKKAA